MANELYNRIYECTITRGGLSLIFTDQRCSFTIQKNGSSEPNQSIINLYNLTPDHRARIKEGNAESPATVEFRVGYQGFDEKFDLKTLTISDLIEVNDPFNGVDNILIMKLGDGQAALQTKTSNVSFKDSSFSEIAANLFSNLAVTVSASTRQSLDDLGQESFLGGYVAGGDIKKVIDGVLNRFGVDWSIQNGELALSGKIDEATATRLAFDTGLLTEPEIMDDGRIKCLGLIQPTVIPESTVFIDTEKTEGFFKVKTAEYVGDTRGNDWLMNIECEEFKATVVV